MAQYQPIVSLAENPEFLRLQQLASGYSRAFRESQEEELETFFSSPMYRYEYSSKEKILTQKIVEAIEAGHPWRVGARPANDDQLLQEPEHAYTIMPLDSDLYILTGIRGAELFADRPKKFDNVASKLSQSCLGQMVMIGAAEAMRSLNPNAGMAYEKQLHGISHSLFVGGDFNGDFKIVESKSPKEGPILDPSGEAQLFAPILSETVIAYHSVEVEITKGLLLHLSSGDPLKLAAIKKNVLQRIHELYDGRGGGNFGDYGYDRFDYHEIIYDPKKRLHDGNSLTNPILVYPQNNYTFLELLSNERGVTFQNTVHGKVERSITIPDADIIEFIATMAAGTGGRTSTKQIVNLVNESSILSSDDLFGKSKS